MGTSVTVAANSRIGATYPFIPEYKRLKSFIPEKNVIKPNGILSLNPREISVNYVN